MNEEPELEIPTISVDVLLISVVMREQRELLKGAPYDKTRRQKSVQDIETEPKEVLQEEIKKPLADD